MESGLLAEPTLLRDMESSMQELANIKTELEQLKKDNKIKGQHIRNIRKNIEMTSELTKSGHKVTIVRKKNRPQVMRGRPSILKPTLPTHAYDHLRDKQTDRKSQFRSIFKL